jgi:uncharacterized pyridoxal phosphate-dependent enzyme
MKNSPNRRQFLQSAAAAAAAGSSALWPAPAFAEAARRASIYETKLGLRPVINGVGTVTNLGGSIMPPEVVEAMVEASRHFIPFQELQVRVGRRLAEMLNVPAAMVTCGAASGITVATAACVAGGDRTRVRQLPDVSGLRNEIVQQRSHRSGYEAQMELVGARIVWVDTREEAERAISDRTAMMFFLNKADPDGQIGFDEWVRIGKERGVPTFNDAAADVPPKERLWEYVHRGFDLVAFSGGKGLLGPQGSGLLLGRPDLIEAGQQAISPAGGIGRGMKVGKEEMMGLLAAVERYLRVDHDAERRLLEDRADHVISVLSKVPGVAAEHHVPPIANRVPHVAVAWNEGEIGLSSADVVARLQEGDPPIMVSRVSAGELRISMWMLRDEEHRVVADRLAEVLASV